MIRVTFVTAVVLYLAKHCIRELGLRAINKHKMASSEMLKHVCIDDVITEANSLDEEEDLIKQLVLILGSAGFPLTK